MTRPTPAQTALTDLHAARTALEARRASLNASVEVWRYDLEATKRAPIPDVRQAAELTSFLSAADVMLAEVQAELLTFPERIEQAEQDVQREAEEAVYQARLARRKTVLSEWHAISEALTPALAPHLPRLMAFATAARASVTEQNQLEAGKSLGTVYSGHPLATVPAGLDSRWAHQAPPVPKKGAEVGAVVLDAVVRQILKQAAS